MSLLPSTEGTLETKGVVGRVAISYPESSGFLAKKPEDSGYEIGQAVEGVLCARVTSYTVLLIIEAVRAGGDLGSIFSRLRESGFQVLLPTTAGSLVRSACP